VLLAAYFAPVKYIDRAYGTRVHLPSTTMTLGELDYMLTFERDKYSMPVSLHLYVQSKDSQRMVRWSSQDTTFQEFVDTIEAQTPLRHRISGCANTETILWGLDYFGFDLSAP
jgi:hypothetical protein